MLTNVYIDGFNLYHRALRKSPFKWLNVESLARALCPDDEVNEIHFFTAKLRPDSRDPTQPQRQQTYLRALQTIPNLTIHYGIFRIRTKRGWLKDPPPKQPHTIATIVAPEEKVTDVNLATQLVFDAFTGACDQALVITNDSDLAVPIRRLRDELDHPVVVANPDRRRRAQSALLDAASRLITIRTRQLRNSQFPLTVLDPASGRAITKPALWE